LDPVKGPRLFNVQHCYPQVSVVVERKSDDLLQFFVNIELAPSDLGGGRTDLPNGSLIGRTRRPFGRDGRIRAFVVGSHCTTGQTYGCKDD
jgi:hypothetical protein